MDWFSWVGSLVGVRVPVPPKLPDIPYRGPAPVPLAALGGLGVALAPPLGQKDVRMASHSPVERLSSVAGPRGGLVANNSGGLTAGAPLSAGRNSWWRTLMQSVARWIPLPVDPKP